MNHIHKITSLLSWKTRAIRWQIFSKLETHSVVFCYWLHNSTSRFGDSCQVVTFHFVAVSAMCGAECVNFVYVAFRPIRAAWACRFAVATRSLSLLYKYMIMLNNTVVCLTWVYCVIYWLSLWSVLLPPSCWAVCNSHSRTTIWRAFAWEYTDQRVN